MASSFLRKKAEEQAKRVDEHYGAAAYGGSSYRKASGTEDKSETGTGSRASSYLQKKAQAQAEKMNQKYGTGASETQTSTSTPTSTRSSRPNAGRGGGTVKTAADIGYDIRQTQSQLDELERGNADGYYSVEDLALAGSLNQQLAQLREAQEAAEKVERQALINSGEYRDATLKDLTLGSLQQGYYNTLYGEESYDKMMGYDNEAQKYADILAGEEYKFLPEGVLQETLSGGMGLLGQIARQSLNKRTVALATGGGVAGGTYGTVAGGGLGSLITAPAGFAAGATAGLMVGNAAASFEVEAGHAYNEMIENGISQDTAKKIALAVGGVNAAIEMAQVDELVDAFKVLKRSGATQNAAKRIADELLNRGIDVMKETGQEVLQEGVTMAGTQAASQIDKGKSAYTWDEAKDRLWDTAKSSMLSFGLINVPGAIRSVTSPGNVQTQTQEIAKPADVFQQEQPEAEKRPQILPAAEAQDTSEGISTSEEKRAAEAREMALEALVGKREETEPLQPAERPVPVIRERIENRMPEVQPSQTVMPDVAERQTVMPDPRTQEDSMPEIVRRTAQLRSDIQAGAQKTLGKEGYRAFEADFRNTPESDPVETYQQLTKAYNEGVVNQRSTDSTLSAARYNAMFEAGRRDAEASLQAQAQRVGQAVVHKGGIDYDDVVTQQYMAASVDQKTAKVIDRTAKALGVRVRFADSVAAGAANAQIENGVVTIEKGNPNPVRFLFGHEITHRMQELAPAEYSRLREAAAEYGWMDAYIKRTQQKYAEHGRSIDNDAAADEAVADFVGTLLEDSGELERFIARSQGDRTLLQKLKDAVHELVVKLKGTEEQKRMLAVEKRLTAALQAASKQAETNAKTQKNTTQEGGVVRFSSKDEVLVLDGVDWMDNFSSIKDQLQKHADEINKMTPVAVVDYTAKPVPRLVDVILDEVAKIGGKNMKNGGVSFVFDEAGTQKIVVHAKSPELRAAAMAAPYVAKNGKLIAGQKNHENSGLTTLTYAAPVIINGTTVNAGVAIQFQANGRPRAVNVGLQSGGVFKIDMKKAPKGLDSRVSRYGQGTSLPTMSASGNTVAQTKDIVKVENNAIFGVGVVEDAKTSLKGSASLAREIARIQKEGTAGKRSDADIRADIRVAVDEAYQGVIADHDVKIKELKKHQRAKEEKGRESRTAVALRAKIQRHAKDLSNKLLNPNDKKHIPEALRGPVAHLLESINLESNYELEYGADAKYHRVKPGESLFAEATKRTKAFAELRKAYAEIADELIVDPDLLGDDGLLNDMAALADKRLLDMTSAELETVWQTIRAVEASIQSANKMFSAAKQKTITEIAEALRSENVGKTAKTEYNGALGKGQKLTGLDMMTPEAFLHRLGSTGDAMFRMMRNAQDEHIRMMKEVADFTHSAMKDVDVKKMEKTMHTVTLGGENVKLSTAQLMELYVLMRREQALEHIMRGGILPDVVSNQGAKKIAKVEPSRGITMEELSEALSLLSDEEVAVAETLQDFASTKLSEYGNKASMQVYNYKKFNEKNYWPIRSNRQEVRSDVQKDSAITSVANRGFTKGTKPHANNSVRLGSIFDTFATHASEMATYAAWLGTSEDINRIRNYTFRDGKGNRTGTVKGIIERVHGTQGSAYLQKLLADIATGVRGTHGETAFMSGIVGNYKAASVGANLRVIIQQPTAILRAMDMINPKYLAAGVLPNDGWKKALKYAPIAQWKDWGYFDINTGRQMKDVLFNSDSALDKVKNASMAGAGAMDSLAWGLLWNSVEAETKAKRKELKMGTDEFYQAVAERFTEIVDHTQVVDGILQRSQIMRSSDGLTKMATSFMAEPTKQYNMLLSAAYDAKHGSKNDRTAAKQRLARTAFALAASGVVNAMAQSILDGLRDDDKEKKYLEKWLNALFGFTGEEAGMKENWDAFWSGNLGNTVNPAAYIPYVKDILSLLQGYDVSRMDMESVEKTITAAQNMTKALSGEGKYTIAGASANLFAEAARLIGMPVANLKREIKAFAMTAAIESDNYVMQYRMEKVALSMNYSGNSGTFMDILFNAYVNNQDAYEIIYADMVSSGYDTAKIKSGMETRMKKAQGVNEAADLEQRYLSPDQQAGYDGTMEAVSGSKLWSKASAEQRDDLEDSLYNLIVGNSAGSSMQEKIDGGTAYGIDETDYLLYKLALDMADKPNDNGKFGTYTNDEVEEAIKMLTGLSDDARAYLWEAQGKNAKSNPWK